MGKALLGATSPAGTTLTSANYAFAGNVDLAIGATEANAQAVCRVAGTFSKLAININATGTSRTYRFRVNAANGNQVVNPTDTTAGVYSDNSNTDTLSAGDKFNFSTSSTGSPTAYWMRTVFEPTSGQANYYQKRHSNFSGVATVYMGIGGGNEAIANTEANAQCKIRTAGTLRYLQVYVASNSRTATSIYKTRKNGADGNSSVSVTSGATGLFEDTSNTDTIATGDLVNYALAPGGTGNIAASFVGSWIISGTDGQSDYFATANGTTRAASGTASYHPFTGTTTSSATEANASIQHGFDARASKLRIYLSANSYSTDATATFRVAAADGNQTVTLTAGATGWFEDTTHTDDFTANQDCCVKIVGGTSGSITIRTIGVTEGPQSVTQQGAAAWTATGTQTAAGKATKAGAAALTAVGTLTATGIKVKFGTAAWDATGTFAANGIVLKLGSAAFSGNGTLAALGLRTRSGASALSATGTLTASATKSGAGVGAFAASGTLAATGIKTRYGLAAFTATGTQTAAGKKTGRGTAALTATGTLTAAGKFNAKGRAAFTATGTLTGLGGILKLGSAAWSAIGTLVAEGRRVFIGKSSAVSTSFTGRTAATNTSGFVGKSSAEATAFTGKTSAQS